MDRKHSLDYITVKIDSIRCFKKHHSKLSSGQVRLLALKAGCLIRKKILSTVPMTVKTVKQFKKILKKLNKLGFKPPATVIAEPNFLVKCFKHKISIKVIIAHFEKIQPKLLITKCCYKKYQSLQIQTKKDISGYFKIKDCGHETVNEPYECLSSIIRRSNRKKYILASCCPRVNEIAKTSTEIPHLTLRGPNLALVADLKNLPPTGSHLARVASEEELERLEKLFGDDLADDQGEVSQPPEDA